MYLKIVVFYAIVFFSQIALSGFIGRNASNNWYAHQNPFTNHNVQINQNLKSPLSRLSSIPNLSQQPPRGLQPQNQNIKYSTQRLTPQLPGSFPPYQQPLNNGRQKMVPNQNSTIEERNNKNNNYQQQLNLSNQKFEKLRINVNQHPINSQRNDQVLQANIERQKQISLKQLENRYIDQIARQKVLPITSLVDDKYKVRSPNIHTRSPLVNTNIGFGRINMDKNKSITHNVPQPTLTISNIGNVQPRKNIMNTKSQQNPINPSNVRQESHINLFQTRNYLQNVLNQGNNLHQRPVVNQMENVHNNQHYQTLTNQNTVIHKNLNITNNTRQMMPIQNLKTRYPVINPVIPLSGMTPNQPFKQYSIQGNNLQQRGVGNQGNNVHENLTNQNKRYPVIHKNGTLDDLEIIRRKYPYLNMTNNMRQLIPTQILKTRYPVINPVKPLTTIGDTNTNQPSKQYLNIRNTNVPLENNVLHTVNNTPKHTIQNNDRLVHTTEKSTENSNFQGPQPTFSQLSLSSVVDQTRKFKTPTLSPSASVKQNSYVQIQPLSIKENKLINITEALKRGPPGVRTAPIVPHIQNISTARLQNVDNKRENPETITYLPKQDSDLSTNKTKERNEPIAFNETKNGESNLVTNQKTEDNKFSKIETNDPKPDKSIVKNQNVDSINKTINDNIDYDYVEEFIFKDSSSLTKPVMWFKTSDPEFWKKMVENDDDLNFLYILNVQSPRKIETDRIKTIHPNGTIVEEITETIWEVEDDKPRVKKTVVVTPHNADMKV